MIVGKLSGAEKDVTFDKGVFFIGDEQTQVEKLTEYDKLGIIEWKSDELKLLVYSMCAKDSSGEQQGASNGHTQTQNQQSQGFSGQRDGRLYLNDVEITNAGEYWIDELTKIHNSKGTYRGKFNWAAFLFGVLWLFYKELYVAGLIWFVILLLLGIFTFGIAVFAGWLYIGFRGNYMFYTDRVLGKPSYF